MKKLSLIIVVTIIASFLNLTYANVFTNGKSEPTTDLIKRLLVEVHRPVAGINKLAYQIKKAEQDYGINPILLISVMDAETRFDGYPQAHVYMFNVDNGIIVPHENVKALPSPFSDVDCVSRALQNQMDTFDGNLEKSIGAYFYGPRLMKEKKFEELDPGNQELVLGVIGFISTHPDDRPNAKTVIPGAGSRVKNRSDTRTFARNSRAKQKRLSLSDEDKKEFSSIEEKYISVMRYFNKSLDEATADEIYWSIAQLHNEFPDVDARLVMSLFAVESAFRPDAVSHKGAQGLGQLMPRTAKGLNVDDPFDASDNVRGTFMYLDREFKRWEDKRYPLDLVLASYNAGPKAVKKYNNNIPPYKETQAYVRKVVNIYSQLLMDDEKEEKLLHKTRFFHRGYIVNNR